MRLVRKLLLTLVLCTMVISSVGNFALAETISSENDKPFFTTQGVVDISNIELDKNVTLSDGAVLTEISFDEYVSRLAKARSISLQEAYEIESRDISLMSRGEYKYYDYSRVFEYKYNKNFEGEVNATIKVYISSDTSFRQIEDVFGISSKRKSGLYVYTWTETSAWSDPREGSSQFPTLSVTIGVDGYFEVTITGSVGGSVDLPGFSVSGEYSWGNTYISRNVPVRATYRVY